MRAVSRSLRFAAVGLAITLGASTGCSSDGVASDTGDAGAAGAGSGDAATGGMESGTEDVNGGTESDAGEGGTDGGDGGTELPASPYFDLTAPSADLFRHKLLYDPHHAMQSVAFDNTHGRMFFAQLQDGGTGDDLCITETTLSGQVLGHMDFNNAGHGVSIGVEPVGADSYLWVETDSSSHTEAGRGTALLRFKFENGKAPSGKKFLTGSNTITCATDPVNDRIAVRRKEGGKMTYSLFSLQDAAKGDFSQPLAHFAQPSLSTQSVTFQGYTIYGQYLYTLDGTGHDDAQDINSYLTRIDMKTGKVKSRALTKAGESLIFREPEGMAVYRTPGGETRLFFSFASRDSLGGVNRYANVFFKNELVP